MWQNWLDATTASQLKNICTGFSLRVKWKSIKKCYSLSSCMYSSNFSEETSLNFLFRKEAMMSKGRTCDGEKARPQVEVEDRRMKHRARGGRFITPFYRFAFFSPSRNSASIDYYFKSHPVGIQISILIETPLSVFISCSSLLSSTNEMSTINRPYFLRFSFLHRW